MVRTILPQALPNIEAFLKNIPAPMHEPITTKMHDIKPSFLGLDCFWDNCFGIN
jgi:hypothetical protein